MLKLFYSYCHDDAQMLAAVRKYCDRLSKPPSNLVEIWYDGMLTAGVNWPSVIEDELGSCDLFVAVITQNFLNSEACLTELGKAIEARVESIRSSGPELPVICPILCGANTFKDDFPGVQPLLEWRDVVRDAQDGAMLLKVYERLRQIAFRLSAPPEPETVPMQTSMPAGTAAQPAPGAEAVAETKIYAIAERDYDLMPFLCDHHRQAKRLSRTVEGIVRQYKETRAAKPLVFIASGPERQSHTAFKIRLRRHTLPRALGDPSVPTPWIDLAWRVVSECDREDLDREAPKWNEPESVTFLAVEISARNWAGIGPLQKFVALLNSLASPAETAGGAKEKAGLKCRALIVGLFFVFRELESERDRAMRAAATAELFQGLENLCGCCLDEFADADADDAAEWIGTLYRDNALTDYERFQLEGVLRRLLGAREQIAVQDLIEVAHEALATLRNLPRKVS